ncbi:MAG TPA: sugar kinase [Steroidobacteraceae bacterium]|nr:sugar kinase [Steroidobacteraceae bacterium]
MAEQPAPSRPGAQVVCFGEILLRLSPPRCERLQQARELHLHVGGAEANVAISLAQLGHRSLMVSFVPQNALGRLCVGELRRHGVQVEGIRAAAGRMGLYFVETGAGHRATQVLYDRAYSAFALAAGEDLPWGELLTGVEWLHLSGVTPALGRRAADATLTAARAAHSRGVRISFDCNYRTSLWSAWAGAEDAAGILREIAGGAELLFASERDLALILGRQPAEHGGNTQEQFAAAALAALARFEQLRYVASTLRIHHGADMQDLTALMMSREGLFSTRHYPLGEVVDRIGSGDAFAAAVLHGLLGHFDTQRVLDFAAAAACLKHALPGDFSLAAEHEIEAVLRGEISMQR